ncbi:uncharacterized protein LOC113205509 isoform X2 [Frankliniella occidentalis]|uniref:Uncharacterized protein LOC113205509 isoform X2 n=1 Tax=Frankliniella occidentalis TaxID=133901 RepID=A0A6J1S7F7_FRAOC|nr:uncharacterized protein LOC113205509 isoform X2 [Frankliniella occidentalis]
MGVEVAQFRFFVRDVQRREVTSDEGSWPSHGAEADTPYDVAFGESRFVADDSRIPPPSVAYADTVTDGDLIHALQLLAPAADMPVVEKIGRRQAIPILYTRGTHYEVGFDVGRTFSGIIQSFLAKATSLNEEYLPAYETDTGRRAYEDTLAAVKKNYPQYVQELQGTADGAKVPFHKLFLLHMDEITPNVVGRPANQGTNGCSTICINHPGQEYIGHTEDALAETLNHVYLVSAHITSPEPQGRWKVSEEKFTALCYAGCLPGFCMGYNHHGMVFTVNIIKAARLNAGKTPRHFLTRALLNCDNFEAAQHVLRDEGCGAGDGVSINMTFLNQEGDRLFHNAEVGPSCDADCRSPLNILTCSPGEHIFHCNKYLRLKIPEVGGMIVSSSDARHATMEAQPDPFTLQDVIRVMGDQSHPEHNIFREAGDDDFVKTVAVGIFDCVNRTWSLYTDNPKTHDPVVVLPLQIRKPSK